MPNPDLFPVEELNAIYAALPLKAKQDGFQYGPTTGYPPLLESLRSYLKTKGLPVNNNGLMITSGSLQAIHFVVKVFTDPDDTIVTENPCFVGAIPVFKYFQAALRGVALDRDGIRFPEAEHALDETGARLLYLTPCFHNPAGILYSPERKRAVLDLLRSRPGLVLLEDDAYNELYFDEKDKPLTVPMKAQADPSLPICYTGSFSKIFGPGMRLGWLLAPPEIIRNCELAKQGSDACSSSFTQVLADAFLRSGYLPGYLDRIRAAYARRAKRMLESLEKHMPDGVTWTEPVGGFYIWLELPGRMDASILLEKAMQKGSLFLVGKAFDPEGEKNNCLRLSFSHTAEEKIEIGLKNIADAMKELHNI